MLIHNVGVVTRVCVIGSVNMDIGFDVEPLMGKRHPRAPAIGAKTPFGLGAG